MKDYTQPSAFKSVDTISLNAESLKFVKEMSDGPFKVSVSEKLFEVKGVDGITLWLDGRADEAGYACKKFNVVWHSRDQELASKDVRIKELEEVSLGRARKIDAILMKNRELEAESERYKKASLLSRQRISAMLHVWEYRDKEAFVSNAGDELRAVVSLIDEALGGE